MTKYRIKPYGLDKWVIQSWDWWLPVWYTLENAYGNVTFTTKEAAKSYIDRLRKVEIREASEPPEVYP